MRIRAGGRPNGGSELDRWHAGLRWVARGSELGARLGGLAGLDAWLGSPALDGCTRIGVLGAWDRMGGTRIGAG